MNLISCDRCGVVLDRDKLVFPDIYDHDSGEIIENQCIWDSEAGDFISVVSCPACDDVIRENQ